MVDGLCSKIQRVSRNITFMQKINHIVKPLLWFQLNLQWKNGKHNHSEKPSSIIVQTSSGFLKCLVKRNLALKYDENWTLIKMKTYKQGMLDIKGTYIPCHKNDSINIPWAYMDLPQVFSLQEVKKKNQHLRLWLCLAIFLQDRGSSCY